MKTMMGVSLVSQKRLSTCCELMKNKMKIWEGILTMRDKRKMETENEQKFATRLSKAAARRGNVHSSEEKTTMFVDGLDESIKTLVAHYREQEKRSTYLEVVQFEREEGEAVRAGN